jgi:hypothetical protein
MESRDTIDRQSLNVILEAVDKFPISSQEVALKARRLNSPQNVINFFESIPGGTVFQDQQDLLDRSITAEQRHLLHGVHNVRQRQKIRDPFEHPGHLVTRHQQPA